MPIVLGSHHLYPPTKLPEWRSKRSSPRLRGYTSRWDAYAKVYRRKHPFCVWCRQRGRLVFGKAVDHKLPVADGGSMMSPENHQTLCLPCHALKFRLEVLARETGQLDQIIFWCEDVANQPVSRGDRRTSIPVA